jgi:hypothetical protein
MSAMHDGCTRTNLKRRVGDLISYQNDGKVGMVIVGEVGMA